MKWLAVFVICLVVELPIRITRASSVEIENVDNRDLPALKLKFLEDEGNKLDSSTEDAVTDTAVDNTTKEDSSKEANMHIVPLMTGVNPLEEEEIYDNELKRVKKSYGLTTICVEIKPTSPYEPPYYMCRGTEPPYHNSKGDHKAPAYGGSGGSYKPISNKGNSYASDDGYKNPPNDYSYGKPSYPTSYGSQEDYSSGGHGMKPGYGGPSQGGYSKPPATGGGYRPDMSPEGYEKPTGPNKYNPKPAKYEMIHDSYAPAYPSSYAKPSKYVIPPSSYYGKPDVEIYDGYSQTYEKPGSSYGPSSDGYNSYGPPANMNYKNKYGEGFRPSEYGAGRPAYGSPYGSMIPSYKPKLLPQHYKKPRIGKYPQKQYGAGKKGQGYSPGGYRTIDIDDDEEEMEFQEDMPMGPQLQSSYNPGMSNYGASRPYMPSPATPVQQIPQTYTYPSPAPQVPCGSNLVFGCHPSVVPAPCYSAPSPQPPVPFLYSAPSPQPPPVMYGPPVIYYSNLGAPHQTTTSAGDQSSSNGMEKSNKDATDIKNVQQGEKSNDNNMRTQANEQNNMNNENPRQMIETQPQNANQQPADPSLSKTIPNQAEILRNAGNGQNADDKAPPMETMRQNGPSQDVEILNKADDDEATKQKIDAIMRMQQMQKMTQIRSVPVDGQTHMRRDVMNGMNGFGMY